MTAPIPKQWKTTAEIPVSEKIIGQVLGQDKSVDLIKKAAAQKRNVLLTGLPGTGKSMLAQAMAEILPVSELHDVLMYPNAADPNNPKTKIVKAGQGRRILQEERLKAQKEEGNMRLMGLLLPIAWFLISFIIWQFGWIPDVVYAATIILGGFLLIGFALGTQMRSRETAKTPKLLVDNVGKKIAPFFEATGARAGALLGDVRHDPLQSHYSFNELYLQKEGQNGAEFVKKPFGELWSEMYEKYGKGVIRNEKGYEAIMLPPEEMIYTLGYKDDKVIVSRILSLNRRPFDGELVDLKVGNRTVLLTPEHKVDTAKGDKEANKISEKDRLLTLIKLELAKIFG